MKKFIVTILMVITMATTAFAAVFHFNDGYGNVITTEDVALTEYQINEIRNYGVAINENTFYVYHKDGNGELYDYTVVLTDKEKEAVK